MAYSQRILETGTTFKPEADGVFLIADFTGTGTDDLVFIKTFDTGTATVEVHVASAESKYQTIIYQKGTTFKNETDGVWCMIPSAKGGRPDLCFIKTTNTPSNMVEVHIASGASDYQTRILETATTFKCESDGTWMMCNFTGAPNQQDLVFIKTTNTGTKSVEVHVASASSNYQTRILETGTTFAEETDGTWILRPWSGESPPDLIFIKTTNAATNTVEVHVASGGSKYQNRILETGTTFAQETDGVWTMSASRITHPDLIFVKTGPTTGTGKVEVHIAKE